MPEKIIHVGQIGDVTFRKNKRSKNVSISIRPLKGVVVNMPFYVSYGMAKNIVEKRQGWILSNLPKIETIENKATVFTEKTKFFTKYRQLQVKAEQIESIKTEITAKEIIVRYPERNDIRSKELQAIIKETIIKVLRIEAKSYLPGRIDVLANQLQLTYNKAYLKNNKTLWGSCSARNNINLNIHLMRLPGHLIDYVIIHELCHTIEKNHGKQFWSLMDSILGDAKKLSKELKIYSIQIY